MRERSPGVRWLRVYAGRSSTGKPVQVSRAIGGGKRFAQAELTKLVAEVVERAGQMTPLARAMTVTELLERWPPPQTFGERLAVAWLPQVQYLTTKSLLVVGRGVTVKVP
jgi:hypothetical protein